MFDSVFVYLKGVFQEVKEYFIKPKGAVPVYYYNENNNWGDIINVYLIEKITGRRVRKCQTRSYKHLLAVGSVIGSSRKDSIVWGSGMLSPEVKLSSKLIDVRAVRGELTREVLLSKGIEVPRVYGDPVVLMKDYYNPNIKAVNSIGIVAHYVDKESPIVSSLLSKGVKLIDIQKGPEEFIDDLLSCEYVLSSSLHGLIVADTYSIPNVRVVISDKVVGGNYKFNDYYSTTDNDNPKYITGEQLLDLDLESLKQYCKISKFRFDKSELLNSFPREYM